MAGVVTGVAEEAAAAGAMCVCVLFLWCSYQRRFDNFLVNILQQVVKLYTILLTGIGRLDVACVCKEWHQIILDDAHGLLNRHFFACIIR